MSNSCGVNITLLPCQSPKVTITFDASDLEYYCDKEIFIMKLNDEQRGVVEENHQLIYWYAHRRHLDLEEWYDLLAIRL